MRRAQKRRQRQKHLLFQTELKFLIQRYSLTILGKRIACILEEDIDAFSDHLRFYEINYVHELLEHPWGQRVVCFYDPDGHIIEVGEKMKAVIERFLKSGMTYEEVAERMDEPVEYE